MSFFKTLFTIGNNDELSEDEREKFEKFSKSNFNSEKEISLDDVLQFIELAEERELIKIKNHIAVCEDSKTIDKKVDISQEEVEEVFKDDTSKDVEIEENESNSSKNEDEINKDQEDKDELNTQEVELEKESEDIEDLDDDNLTTDEIELSDDVQVEFEDELEIIDSNKESKNSEDEEYKIDDVEMSTVSSKSIDSNDEPILFSVVHDELMELFDEGQIVLLKEAFEFPSLGQRETLAFGIYNSNYSKIKEQTHWFVQHLKDFSRLKECKMLLSEDNEKDLILEIGESHAILISFKTTNIVGDEFEFNRNW